jgi:hypothetical protein
MRFIRIITVIAFIAVLSGCATVSGSSIVTGEKRISSSPDEVKIYLDTPPKFETIGLVEAVAPTEVPTQKIYDDLMMELRKQAAKNGANGVILINIENRSASSGSSTSPGFVFGVGGEAAKAFEYGSVASALFLGTNSSASNSYGKTIIRGRAVYIPEESEE